MAITGTAMATTVITTVMAMAFLGTAITITTTTALTSTFITAAGSGAPTARSMSATAIDSRRRKTSPGPNARASLAEEACEARHYQTIVHGSPFEVIGLSRCGFLALPCVGFRQAASDRRLICPRVAISHAGPDDGGFNEIVALPLRRSSMPLAFISARRSASHSRGS
jgi:hypothetical protein